MSSKVNNINELVNECAEVGISVSYETKERLQTYADLLKKWQVKINLVSNSTISDLWQRHMMDSAQLMRFIPERSKVMDMGSGAGFPGLVLAMFGCVVTLVESDQRKCAFMHEVALQTRINVQILNQRLGEGGAGSSEYVTARALASLPDLLEYAEPWLSTGAKAVFLKGSEVNEELTLAKRSWHIDYQVKPSLTDSKGAIVLIERATRV